MSGKKRHRVLRGSEILYMASIFNLLQGFFYGSPAIRAGTYFASLMFFISSIVSGIRNIQYSRIPSNRKLTIILSICSIVFYIITLNFPLSIQREVERERRTQQFYENYIKNKNN